MCTLLVAHRVWPELPLLVAANRDEQLARPAEGPAVRDDGPRPVVAPRDRVAGGTWLGMNDAGVVAAVTNRFGPPPDRSRRSRGELVLRALEEGDAAAAGDAIEALAPTDYNGYHLVVADRRELHVLWSDGARLARFRGHAGVHVVTERSFDAAPSLRCVHLEQAVEAWESGPIPGDEDVASLLSRHDQPPLEGICIHADAMGYGTRSSSILRLPRDGDARWLYAGGPPCRAGWEDMSGLIARLSG
ncbi:MAG: NRDE family protein [Myxococcota bacterium]